MLILWKHKLVLFAVPKTGTTALEAALAPYADAAILNPPGMKHCTVAKYERELAGFFEQKGRRPLERMAVVREPVSWLGSWFRYRQRPALDGHPKSTRDMTFDAFVAAWLLDAPPAYAQVGQQARFLNALGQPPAVTHLFCHEALSEAVAFLETRLEVTLALGARNVSPKVPFMLSAELEQRLHAERPDEFRIWDIARKGR
jgi:hypothetical protein